MVARAKIERLVPLIVATRRLIREQVRNRNRVDPFSFLRLETLRYVAEQGTPAMKDVADYLGVTPPSATSLIEGLVKIRRLTRAFDKRDRRIVRLAVTPSGKRAMEHGFKRMRQRMKGILVRLNDRELDDLSRILKKLSRLYTTKTPNNFL